MTIRLIALPFMFSFLACLDSIGLAQQATQEAPTEQLQKFDIPATDDGLPGVGPIRRMEWFQDLWRTKRSQWADEVDQGQGSLVFFGDSITQGWGEDFGGVFPGVKTANRGISGDTTRGMLMRVDEDVLSLNPSGVVLLMGTNDIAEMATPKQVAENIGLIIEKIKAHNAAIPIFLCNVFPSSNAKERPPETIQEINRLIAELVKGESQVMPLDTWLLFADENGNAKESEFPDLLHPNKLGYQKWAGALKPAFATYDFLDTQDDSFEIEPEFESLFNGHDLSGWCFRRPSERMLKRRTQWKGQAEWPEGKQTVEFGSGSATPDGRYVAKHGRMIVTSPPEGRRVQQIWTTRQFPDDMTLRLEFRATPNADSGVFVRGVQLQCRDYPLAGPYKKLTKYRVGDWNELEIVVTGNVAHCTCNGEVLEEALELPESGPIGLEGDRGQLEYRRIRIKSPNSSVNQ